MRLTGNEPIDYVGSKIGRKRIEILITKQKYVLHMLFPPDIIHIIRQNTMQDVPIIILSGRVVSLSHYQP